MKQLLCALCLLTVLQVTAQDVVDYRYAQSAVRNQKARGTCTAFSICAALETFPGIPSDLSEQYLFAKAKFSRAMEKDTANMADNEMLEYYLDILEKDGVVTESKMPYDTNAVTFTNDRDVFTQFADVTKGSRIYDMLSFFNVTYRISKDAYAFYYGNDAKDIELIKYWLKSGVKGIPVSYAINSAAWSSLSNNAAVITPDSVAAIEMNGDTMSYTAARNTEPGLLQKILNDEVTLVPLWSNGVFDGGHAVTVVGYNKEGFIIKNSWGKAWGEKGYAVVSYDYHKLWCRKALIFNQYNVNTNFKPKAGETFNAKDICLKTMPLLTKENEPMIGLSFLYDGDKPAPVFKNITINFYVTNRQTNTKKLIDRAAVMIVPDAYNNGYFTFKKLDVDWSDLYNNRLSASVKFTLADGKVITNVYPSLEWKNRTLRPGFLDALKIDDDL